MNAVIGHTGFIGGILKKSVIGDYFNSKNIEDLKNKSYDTIYCAGVSAQKFYANRYPDEDKKKIDNLLQNIHGVKCKKFILISTISIYDDESYGINRKEFEKNLIDLFGDKLLIVRLPAVYGEGMKKNLLFDMLNNKLFSKINLHDKYQWYNVENIKTDINKIKDSSKRIVEFFPEPISNEILISLFDKHFEFISDMDSAYIQNIIPSDGYYYSSDIVIKKLKKFIDGYR